MAALIAGGLPKGEYTGVPEGREGEEEWTLTITSSTTCEFKFKITTAVRDGYAHCTYTYKDGVLAISKEGILNGKEKDDMSAVMPIIYKKVGFYLIAEPNSRGITLTLFPK